MYIYIYIYYPSLSIYIYIYISLSLSLLYNVIVLLCNIRLSNDTQAYNDGGP